MNNIRKIWFLIFFIFFISKSNAEIINKIEVEGNQRISLETIAIFGDIIIGNNYEAQDINSLIKKLYETSFFSNINVKLESGVLFISVKENPIINTITFNGEKAKKYIDVLNEYLTLREKTSFVKNYIKSDIDIIKNFIDSRDFILQKLMPKYRPWKKIEST